MSGSLFLINKPSSRPSIIKPLTASIYLPIKRYSQTKKENGHGHVIDERAPSTAEEFERVAEKKRAAEEKLRVAEQGLASQTFDKASDGTQEAVGDSNSETVKKRNKEREPGADYRRRGDDKD